MNNDLKKYEGVVVPMVTPLTAGLEIDEAAVERISASFIENGVQPLILGTTGEVASLAESQKIQLVKSAVKAFNGKVPVVAAIFGNALFSLVEQGEKYANLGVDALVTLVPNYYPVDDAAVLNWFEQLANKLPLPMFLYNIPATTHHSVSLDVIEKLSHHSNIIGIKDSQSDVNRLDESLERWSTREDFLFLVGCAANSCYGLKRGANGIVPSGGNLFPQLYAELFEAAKNKDFNTCQKLQDLTDITSKYSQEGRTVTQAIPALKALMSIKGLCEPHVMPPMQRMVEKQEMAFLKEMKDKILHPEF